MRHFSKDKLKADLKEYQFKNIDLEKLATSSVSKLQKTIRNNFAEIAAKHYYCKFSKKQNNCPTGKPPIDCPYFHYNTCLERFINLFPDYKAIVGKNNDNTIIWTIVNKKDTIFEYIFWERLDSLPIPE